MIVCCVKSHAYPFSTGGIFCQFNNNTFRFSYYKGSHTGHVNIFLPSILTFVLGRRNNCLLRTVLLSTHNICFDGIFFNCTLFSGGMGHSLAFRLLSKVPGQN